MEDAPMRKHSLLISLPWLLAFGCGETAPTVGAPVFDAGWNDDTEQQQDPSTGNDEPDAGESDASVVEEEPFPDAGKATPAPDVEVVITSDNAFSFGYGGSDEVNTYVEGVPSSAEGIFDCPVGFGPQPYLVPGDQAPNGAYLYIVAWADQDWTQGALAQFTRVGGASIYSGDGAWQVCATGLEFDPELEQGPDQTTVNGYVRACNAGAEGDTYSKGWVDTQGAVTPGARGKLAFGETNASESGDFPLVCQLDEAGVRGIDAEARWMWFDPEDGLSAFVDNTDNRTQSFLIFRLPADALILL
jgi:hypothetical protein